VLLPEPSAPAPSARRHVVVGPDLDALFADPGPAADLPTMAVPVVGPAAEPPVSPPTAVIEDDLPSTTDDDEPRRGRRGRRSR
jgi:hypothetical protein